jgi:flagellar hook assembly protein FlgD
MPGPNVNNTFNWNTTGCAGGIYYVVFTYTDECGDVGADTCKYEIKTACAFVRIGETEGDPGQTINLPVLLTPTGADIGGFDFCIEFNNTELTAISVSRGNLIDDIEQASGKHAWHYFTYRLNPSTVIHKFKVCVIGIGRLYHYSDGMCIPQSDQEDTLFTIKFVLVNNQLFRCFWTPVIFEWDAWTCMENTLSDCTGNEVYVSDDPALYDPQECGLGEKNDIIPCVNFSDGAVIFRCPEDVDPVVIGDVNVNGSPYEIGDAVLFASYFLDGLSVFSNDNDTRQAQIGGTDINRDGYVLTVADLVYLLRILAGDQEPLGEGTSQSTAVAKVNYDGRNVKVETPEALGAIWVIFKGEGKVIDMSGENLTLQWKAANGETKVLVYGKIGSKNASIKTSDLFAVKGELELSRVEAATFQGSPIKVELTGKGILPSEFKLLQNFPNPFNATTQISFALPKDGNVSLKIYNVAGQLVKTYDSFMTAGYRTITWDGTNKSGDDVASGVYFYNLKAEEFTKTLKMTLLK